DLLNDFEYKKEVSNLSKIKDPEEQFFELNKKQSVFYDSIIKDYFSETGNFKGAIYKPFEYEKKKKDEDKLNEEDNRAFQQQRNLHDFMRRLLIKRFESSFGAFAKSIERFLRVNKMVLSFVEHSGKYVLDRKVIENIYNDEDDADDFTAEAIEKALKDFEENAKNKTTPKHTKIYDVNKFVFAKEFVADIKNDIRLFETISDSIKSLQLVEEDPKRKAVISAVKKVLERNENPKRKVILFTEYTDTVKYLVPYFEKEFKDRIAYCDGSITKSFAQELDANFNAKYPNPVDKYDVLITSDKLSEGFNLNRAGLIINYDIPWNPTRVIQRVGRINRMSAKVFDELEIFNFFPTEKGASKVNIKEIAQQKMFLIHNALGEDAKIFEADEEPTASGLFSKMSKNPEDNEDLSTITVVRNDYQEIKEQHPEIIERISDLPNRTKTAKDFSENNVVVLRKKGMSLFSLLHKYDEEKAKPIEQSFDDFIPFVKCEYDEKRLKLNSDFWKSYEEIKAYTPKYNTGKSDIALENKAVSSLKTLLKQHKNELDEELIVFVNTLLKDIKKYKTLPKYTLRDLVLPTGKNASKKLIENIKDLKRKLGADYLDLILSRVKNLEEDVIIAVGNLKNE
ncbi:MAG: SWF/SNF helicase family protein, partial [Flavobacteriaceae bacterium]|nr:SWF/SNF helicase family protein [Flavobacteriaceae bacterium]